MWSRVKRLLLLLAALTFPLWGWLSPWIILVVFAWRD